jgi:hypothetical protein
MSKKFVRLSLTVVIVLVLSLLGNAVAVLAANPSANLDQCANDPAPSPSSDGCNSNANQWVNGNLGASKALYFEGDSIPYRLRFDNLSLASHTVTIEWDTTKSGKHALDYIDDFNESVLNANPCLGVSGCSPATFTTFAIPADPQVTGAGVTPLAGDLRLYGGTIMGVSAYSYPNGSGFTGDKSARITITFTASRANPVLAWGGHISTRVNWGANGSAVAIPGSPYHTRLINLDGSGGNQDRSLSADAVVFPGSITIIKDAVPNDPQDFSFSTTGGLSPATFMLDDDSNGTLSNTQLFSMLTNFTTYTVTEAAVSHWTLSFGNPVCSVSSPNGGSQTGNAGTRVLTINLKEGENVTCTFINTHDVSSPTLTTLLSSNSVSIGGSVHDSATLSGATADAGGTVTYTVYSDNSCTTSVASGGTKTVTNGVVPNSDSVTFNSAGTFYWQAAYSGDANNSSALSDCTSEQMVVNKNAPTIATVLSDTSVAIGTPVHDSSTLSGATSNASGSVTYTVYSDNACSQNAQSAGTVTVTNGMVPDSNAITFNAAGTYYWQAAYSGDANNDPATSACQSEIVTVNPNAPGITTLLSSNSVAIGVPVHDSSTLTGATNNAGGTVTYTVYSDNACTTSVASGGTKTVTNGVVPDSDAVSFNAAGTYYWQAVYSGDANNQSATSVCTSEQVVVNPNAPTIATVLSAVSAAIGEPVHDSSTLSGATADAGGTVTYAVYSDDQCSTFVAGAGTKTVTNGIVPDSDSVSFNAAGTYYWQATYSGDSNNDPAMSACQSEIVTINRNGPSITTTLSTTTANIGDSVFDSATLSGATSNAGGTVTYTVYSDSSCTTSVASGGTKNVTNGSVPNSDDVTFNSAGDFYWQAVYSGDANNQGATSTCTEEHLVVNKNQPSNSTAQNLLPNDSFTLSGATANASGTVTFNLYNPNDATCSGTPALTQTVNVNGNGTYNTTNTTFLATTEGTWRWLITYSGDANNEGTTSACGVEQFTIANH